MKYRCPESECGARLEAPKPTVIAPGVNGGVVVLDPSIVAESAKLAKTLERLEQEPPKYVLRPDEPCFIPAPASETRAQAPRAPVAYDGDIVSFMRARLASIESEARKIRAMLKVAEATE